MIVNRKQYDESGENKILGIPYVPVTEEFDGGASSGNVSITDAYDIEDINIDDNHSTSVLSLVANILDVKCQNRKYGYKINNISVKQYLHNLDIVDAKLNEIDFEEDILIDGIKIDKIYDALIMGCFYSINASSQNNIYDSDVIYTVVPQEECEKFNNIFNTSDFKSDMKINMNTGRMLTCSANSLYLICILNKNNLQESAVVVAVRTDDNIVPDVFNDDILKYNADVIGILKSLNIDQNITYSYNSENTNMLQVFGNEHVSLDFSAYAKGYVHAEFILENYNYGSYLLSNYGHSRSYNYEYTNYFSFPAGKTILYKDIGNGQTFNFELIRNKNIIYIAEYSDGKQVASIHENGNPLNKFEFENNLSAISYKASNLTMFCSENYNGGYNRGVVVQLNKIIIIDDEDNLHILLPSENKSGEIGVIDICTSKFYKVEGLKFNLNRT